MAHAIWSCSTTWWRRLGCRFKGSCRIHGSVSLDLHIFFCCATRVKSWQVQSRHFQESSLSRVLPAPSAVLMACASAVPVEVNSANAIMAHAIYSCSTAWWRLWCRFKDSCGCCATRVKSWRSRISSIEARMPQVQAFLAVQFQCV